MVNVRDEGDGRVAVTARVGVPASPPATRLLVEWVASGLELAGWPRAARSDVVLAVDEAVQNAVEHGSEPEAPVVVELDADHARARVTVRDLGRRGCPTPVGVPVAPSPHSIRGRGRVIMVALADDARWHDCDDGTEVALRFTCGGAAPEARPGRHQERVRPPSTRSDCPVT